MDSHTCRVQVVLKPVSFWESFQSIWVLEFLLFQPWCFSSVAGGEVETLWVRAYVFMTINDKRGKGNNIETDI